MPTKPQKWGNKLYLFISGILRYLYNFKIQTGEENTQITAEEVIEPKIKII